MRWPPMPPVIRVLQEIRNQNAQILRNTEVIMSQQSTEQNDINAATDAINAENTSVQAVADDLNTAAANIQAEIAALKAANPAVDTTALDTAVAGLSAPITALQSADTSVDGQESPAAPPAA